MFVIVTHAELGTATAALAETIFRPPAVPFVVVQLTPDEVIPGDVHPNPKGAARMAELIVARLGQGGGAGFGSAPSHR